MSSYPHPIIAREGWPCVAIALVAAPKVAVGDKVYVTKTIVAEL